ncbi:hypothetical protein D3C76_1462700 [compost metagenome]
MADLIFRQPPDLGTWAALAIGFEQLRQAALRKRAGLDVIAQDLGQQVGRVDQGFLGGLAHHRANLFAHGIEQEITRQPHEQEIHQEDPDPQAHQACSGL